MEVACLVSGGKDSIYATYLAMQEGHKVKYLVTMFPKSEESWMFHYPCIELTKLQSEALNINQIIGRTKGEKEIELEDLKDVLENISSKIEGVVSGAVASRYQKSRIDGICNDLGLKSLAPLWKKEQAEVLKDEIEANFDVMIVGVYAEGFDASWLGRKIDKKCLKDLMMLSEKHGINICGEGGEYESFVLDCPLFKKRVKILDYETKWDKKTNSGYLSVRNAILEEK